MAPLFKYMPIKYARSFLEHGEVLFRSLSYFRNYEELHTRGDQNEGRRLYHPENGLEITRVASGEKSLVPGAFVSRVKEREIFVFCLSSVFSMDLAREFNATACITLHDPVALIARVRSALALRRWVRRGRLLHDFVTYYSPSDPPIAEWAVPERMIMSKTFEYKYQAEYRLAFARGDALRVNNVDSVISSSPEIGEPILAGHPQHLLRLGNLAKICTVDHIGEAV